MHACARTKPAPLGVTKALFELLPTTRATQCNPLADLIQIPNLVSTFVRTGPRISPAPGKPEQLTADLAVLLKPLELSHRNPRLLDGLIVGGYAQIVNDSWLSY